MNIPTDIDAFVQHPYGLQRAINIFGSYADLDFFQAEMEWQSVLETCESVIRDQYGIDPQEEFAEATKSPFLLHVRDAYHDDLVEMPSTIEECNAILDGMSATLDTIRKLDLVTPFLKPGQRREPIVRELSSNSESFDHIPSLVVAGRKSIENWNKRRAVKKQPLKTAWEKKTYEQAMMGRVTRRIFEERREARTWANCILRWAENDEDGLELIDWVAEDIPGVSDMLAAVMIDAMQENGENRIRSVLEECH